MWVSASGNNDLRFVSRCLTQRHGGRTRVKATAISWENPTPGGWHAPQGENFLKRVQYEITLERPNQR